jgi:hypothetical protein
MKNASIKILTLALLGAAGCATPERVVQLQGVGPASTAIKPDESAGFLQVYTAREQVPANINGEEFAWNNDYGRNDFLFFDAHTGYSILGEDGRLVRHVRNSTGMNDPQPKLVSLSPGSYRIQADAVDYNDVSSTVLVPVCVEAGLVTLVHLDGNWNPSGIAKGADLVRLPNGDLVGWHCPSSEPAHMTASITH